MSRVGLTAGLFVLLMAAGVDAQAKPARAGTQSVADDQEARDLFKLGKQAFDEGRYERALKYFRDAYELSQRAALLSNIGTVLDRLRRDAEALEAYKSYLAQVPDAANRGLVEERVRLIEEAMRKDESPPPAATPVPTPAETAQAEVTRAPPPGPVQAPPQATQAPAESSSNLAAWLQRQPQLRLVWLSGQWRRLQRRRSDHGPRLELRQHRQSTARRREGLQRQHLRAAGADGWLADECNV